MPSCDFNGPCTCVDCRTKTFDIKCTHCGFKNSVDVIGTGEIVAGRKGGLYSEFKHPTEPRKELICFKCNVTVEDVTFYNHINTYNYERRLEEEQIQKSSKPCMGCGISTVENYGRTEPISLKKHNGSWLCQNCITKQLKSEKPDPSNEKEKYEFNEQTYQWVLKKVRIPCSTCGQLRWINIENSWKTQCGNCFKKNPANQSTEREIGKVMNSVTFLEVPYEEKNEAKSLGAMWNLNEKKWYVPSDEDVAKFLKWLPDFAHSQIPITERPSEVTDDFWLNAKSKKKKHKKDTHNSGKWLLFIHRAFIDQAWAVVKDATEKGELTAAAKVSTAIENPNAKSKSDHVICVYTYDWTDEEDVLRVREKLRELGFKNKIPYKADQDTLAMNYSDEGKQKISKYASSAESVGRG